jgi:hypothetical protein
MANETVAHYLYFCSAHDDARQMLYAASPRNRYQRHLLNDPKRLPDLFAYVQRTRHFRSVFGDFKAIEPPEDK